MRVGMDATKTDTRTAAFTASQFYSKHIHFIGIGGCGMSGLARMLLDAGAVVTGSEPSANPQTFELTRRGAKISRDQMGELLSRDVDLVVRTAAVPDNNRELLAARALGLAHVKYAELLGRVMAERFGIAVAGTHGKSTTTAMISYALMECGIDPSFVVGGTAPQIGGGSRSGASNIFVAEACEFDRSFHNLRPRVAIITNIEEDHLDCYKDISEIIDSFKAFAKLVPPNGLIIAGARDPHIKKALHGILTRTELVSLSRGFSWSTEILAIDRGCYHGAVSYKGQPLGTLSMSLAGEHNLTNATLALAACHAAGADMSRAITALSRFSGVDRRMTVMGNYNGATVVDDYGHHPTEIRATLKALRQKYNPRRLLCVFQPHQHSRTRFLLEDFAGSFELADETIVPDIYFVRDSETERQKVSSAELVARINRNGQKAAHLPEFSAIVDYLKATARQDDLVVTMGAGNVWEIGRDLIAN